MKVTLITGASSGLGKELAKLYAKDNNNLLLIGTNETRLNEVKDEVLKDNSSIQVEVMATDLSVYENLKKVEAYCKEKGYFVNNVVNNAGFGDCSDFKDMDIDLQVKMTEVDCNAVLFFSRVFLDDMLANNEGHILNVSSIAAYEPGPFMCTYHACKAYVLYLSEAISYELRKTNVKVTALCPGPFESGFVGKAHNDYTFSKIKPISAAAVAKIGYDASNKGKRTVVVGFKNKCTLLAVKLMPKSVVLPGSAATLKKQ